MMRVIHEVILAHPKNGDRVYARAYQDGKNFVYEYRHRGHNWVDMENTYREVCIYLKNVQFYYEDQDYKLLVKY